MKVSTNTMFKEGDKGVTFFPSKKESEILTLPVLEKIISEKASDGLQKN